jgi:transposase InsO family protein
MFFSDLKDPDYPQALLMVDIFTKYTVVVPVKSKQIPDVSKAIEQAITKMGGKPKTVYSDNEGAFVSNEIQKYFKEKGIRHITTLGHAPVAERQIRTIKNMVYPRVEKTGQKWHEVLYAVMLTYNNKLVHSITKFTPAEAMKPSNHLDVKLNLELKAKHSRKYPNVAVGDCVKVFKKKDKLDKERLSLWSKQLFRVDGIIESMGQKFYKLEGKPKALMRGEILLQN